MPLDEENQLHTEENEEGLFFEETILFPPTNEPTQWEENGY